MALGSSPEPVSRAWDTPAFPLLEKFFRGL
nr:MAG TPA: hypothetical protein [Caudoviricetes sp.]